MGLCAKAVQAPDRCIEFFEALESRVQIIKQSSLGFVSINSEAVLKRDAPHAIGNAKGRLAGG